MFTDKSQSPMITYLLYDCSYMTFWKNDKTVEMDTNLWLPADRDERNRGKYSTTREYTREFFVVIQDIMLYLDCSSDYMSL